MTASGVTQVGAFLGTTVVPDQEIALCRAHLRSLVEALDLVEVLDVEERDD